MNIKFDDFKWTLCALPVKDGGVGIRMIRDVGLPAFLSSINSPREPIHNILPVPDSDDIHVAFYDGGVESILHRYTETTSNPKELGQNHHKIN